MTLSGLRFALICASAATLAACSGLPDFGGAREKNEAATAEERAGRITMVLNEEELVASPDLAATAIALPPAEPTPDWTQAGFNASKVVGHITAAPQLTVAWRTNVGEGSNRKSALTTPPVASASTVFVLDASQTVHAVDIETGRKVWTKRLTGLTRRDKIGSGGGLAVAGDKLIVASGFGYVKALSTAAGDELWMKEMGAPMTGAPTIRDGRIFVASNNNEVFALDLETGQTQWSDQAISETARVLGSPSPAAVEEFVIAPYSSGEVIAYLASNGRRLWTDAISQAGRFTPISEINDIGSRPVLTGGLVFAASQSGSVVAIDGRSGQRVWTKPIGSAQAPALVGATMFIAGNDGRVAALDAPTGEAYWIAQLPQFENADKKKNRISYAGPIVASDRVLVIASTGQLIALSPQTGEEVGSVKLGATTYIEPIAVQDKLFVLTDDAKLIAIQ
jgi:outer membrane protein assembly factor BamB